MDKECLFLKVLEMERLRSVCWNARLYWVSHLHLQRIVFLLYCHVAKWRCRKQVQFKQSKKLVFLSVPESFSPKVIITQAKVFKASQVSTFQVQSFTNMKNGFHGQLNSLLFKEDCYRKELKIEEASETLKGKSRYWERFATKINFLEVHESTCLWHRKISWTVYLSHWLTVHVSLHSIAWTEGSGMASRANGTSNCIHLLCSSADSTWVAVYNWKKAN